MNRMGPVRITPGGVAGTILVLLVAGVCVRLGFWQLDRLGQRLERNRLIEERVQAPALPIGNASVDTAGLAYRRVELRGEYDHARSFVLAGRSLHGVPGVYVITPLRLEDGRGVVLVQRGWLPSADAAHVDVSPYDEAGTVRLEGLALPFFAQTKGGSRGTNGHTAAPVHVSGDDERGGWARVWFRPDADVVRSAFPYPVASFIVQALPYDGAPEYPTRLPPPELDRGPHLGYAVQWFSFAAIGLIGWIVMVVRRDGDGAPKRSREPGR